MFDLYFLWQHDLQVRMQPKGCVRKGTIRISPAGKCSFFKSQLVASSLIYWYCVFIFFSPFCFDLTHIHSTNERSIENRFHSENKKRHFRDPSKELQSKRERERESGRDKKHWKMMTCWHAWNVNVASTSTLGLHFIQRSLLLLLLSVFYFVSSVFSLLLSGQGKEAMGLGIFDDYRSHNEHWTNKDRKEKKTSQISIGDKPEAISFHLYN